MEYSTSLRPVSLHSCNLKIPVTRNKQEVIVHELLPNSLIHPCKWIVSASQVTSQVGKCFFHKSFHIFPLLFCYSRRKSKTINGTSHSDAHRVDRNVRCNISKNLWWIHIRCVLCRWLDSMVLLNDWVKHLCKILVWVPIPCVYTAVLVGEVNRHLYSLPNSEPWSLSFLIL